MTRFTVAPGEMCLSCDLGPMTVLYHRRSGTTHMVSEPVPQILGALAEIGPVDAEGLANHLAAGFDLADAEDVAVSVAARLEELAALGLISRA